MKAKYPKIKLSSVLKPELLAVIKNHDPVYNELIEYQFGGKNKNIYNALSDILRNRSLHDNINQFVEAILLNDITGLFITEEELPGH
ncbi:hypothetical protein B1207_06160 [Legionella quinlivanii]|uniref:Uncharacterized protein n=1 Tax=Legionella quinlivanii TaxID=45073 RepID=A0A364LK93_9GAMM|nr:hypothetical protein [Legionella quinlivanii]RAP37010.1 hypothetical protein B1207_06160 [Legionella quinlivanii]